MGGGGQMFELNADPDEQNDLYNNPDFADKRQELLERLINITPRPHRMLQSRLQGNYIASDRAPRYIPI